MFFSFFKELWEFVKPYFLQIFNLLISTEIISSFFALTVLGWILDFFHVLRRKS